MLDAVACCRITVRENLQLRDPSIEGFFPVKFKDASIEGIPFYRCGVSIYIKGMITFNIQIYNFSKGVY